MTVREWAENFCVERGMFEDQAEAVVDRAIEDKVNESMSHRWDDSIDAYPKTMLAVLTFAVRGAAVAWIEENCPQAWYKPMFSISDESIDALKPVRVDDGVQETAAEGV